MVKEDYVELPKESDKISGKVVKQNGIVTVSVSAHLNFGDIAISVQTQDEPDENVYSRAQNAIDFIKENMKEKENPYYG